MKKALVRVENELAEISRGEMFLSKAQTISEAKHIADAAEALQRYLKKVKAGYAPQNRAAALATKARRKAGKIAEGLEEKKGGGAHRGRKASVTTIQRAVEASGVSRVTLNHWERLAAQYDEAAIDKAAAEATEANPPVEFTTSLLIKELKEEGKKRKRVLRDAARRKAAESVESLPESLVVGDFRMVGDKIANGSLALIFTDPPYEREYQGLWSDLGRFAAAKLASGGSLICYTPHVLLPQAISDLSSHLRYWWCCACIHSGSHALMREYGIRVGWKPMVWFVKDTRHNTQEIIQDTITGGQEKADHDWQQALEEAIYYIKSLCPADGIVCDPMAGSGTTLVAAKQCDRQWLGIEINPDTAAVAASRLAI